jgi:hypothetical protein
LRTLEKWVYCVGSPRLNQFVGLVLIVISAAMSLVVYQATLEAGGSITELLAPFLISWGMLAFPELAIGFWLVIRGAHQAKVGDVSGELIRLVSREGRVSVAAAAREIGVGQDVIVDAADSLSRKRLPLVYLDRRSSQVVSPRSVELKESLLHLLFAQRRMTFRQISEVTEATEEQIIKALKELSRDGKFRGTIDENSKVVYTKEAVEALPNAITSCPNCGGELAAPILPGEEEVCPFCGHMITNKVKL